MNFKWVVKIFHGLLRSTGEKKKKEMSWVQSVQAVVTVLGWVASVLGHMAHESPSSSQHLIHTHPVPTTDENIKLHQSIKQARDYP